MASKTKATATTPTPAKCAEGKVGCSLDSPSEGAPVSKMVCSCVAPYEGAQKVTADDKGCIAIAELTAGTEYMIIPVLESTVYEAQPQALVADGAVRVVASLTTIYKHTE